MIDGLVGYAFLLLVGCFFICYGLLEGRVWSGVGKSLLRLRFDLC